MMSDRGRATRVVVTFSRSIGLSLESVHMYVGKKGTSDTMPLCGHPAWDRRRYTEIRSHGLGFLSRQPSSF